MSTKNVRRANKNTISKATTDGLEIYQDDTDNLLYYKDNNGRIVPLDSGGLISVTSDTTLTGAGTVLSPLSVVATSVLTEISYAASDATTPLTVSDAGVMFATHDMTIQSVFGAIGIVGGTSGVTTIDIKKNGVSILSTLITVDFGEATSLTAAVQPVVSVSSILKGDKISANITTISGGGTEAGLQITLNGVRT